MTLHEIAYRAWFQGDELEKPHMIYDVEYTYDYRCQGKGCHAESFSEILESDRYIVMEFTGYTDKHGTRIFEGDLLKKDGSNTLYHVVYHEGAWCYSSERHPHEFWNLSGMTYLNDSPNMEVVGNMFESSSSLALPLA